MPKKPSRKTAKNKAWKEFSRYIRLRDADKSGICTCVTCGKKDHYKKFHAGHAVGGRNNSVLFHEDLVRAQCVGCNVMLNGNYNQYALFMVDKYGREKFEEFLNLRHQTLKISLSELEEIRLKYKAMADELELKKA